MKNDYLPIGSIVTVNGKKMMIIGYDQNTVSDNLTTSDYLGCEYPYGLLNITSLSVFNQNDITSVDFEGYVNDSYNSLLAKLGKTVTKASSTPVSQSIYQFDDDGFVIGESKPEEEVKPSTNKKPIYKFDENGVVISEDFVEELMPTDVAPNQYLFDAEKDAQSDVVKDNTVLTIDNNDKSVNYIGAYKFDENGTVIEDNSVKKEEKYSADRGTSQYKFDEDGFVIAEESIKPKYAFDKDGFVISEA